MVQKWVGEGCSAHLGDGDPGRPSGPLTVPGVGVAKLHSPCPHGTPSYTVRHRFSFRGLNGLWGTYVVPHQHPKKEIQC